jgi:hypothetical protein
MVLQTNDEGSETGQSTSLVTEPIKNLDIKGTFHLDRGYYYFRNIGEPYTVGVEEEIF